MGQQPLPGGVRCRGVRCHLRQVILGWAEAGHLGVVPFFLHGRLLPTNQISLLNDGGSPPSEKGEPR